MIIDLIIIFLYSYILGSIPFGLIITKVFLKQDVRKIGSGNIGATNVLRAGNKKLAILTLILDVLKGYIVVTFSLRYFNEYIYFSSLICFLGHIYPMWLKFKGGKGVATYLGIILGFSVNFGLVFCLSWIVILLFFKYSSLSSIVSTLIVFIYSLSIGEAYLSCYLFIATLIVTFTHRENITRLKNKNENKIKL